MMFGRKKEKKSFDRETLKPVIRASICTGEQVAGFRNIQTGKFSEVVFLRTQRDLDEFLETYGISPEEISTVY